MNASTAFFVSPAFAQSQSQPQSQAQSQPQAAPQSPPPAPTSRAASTPAHEAGATASPLITRGQQQFDDQQYEESLQTLSAALVRPGNSTAQRIDIYRLLAYNYITLNRRDEAESACRGLFAIEPTYALPERESPRFRDYFADVKKRWEAEGRPGLVTPAEPPPAPVTMRHASPSQADANSDIPLTAHLDDPQHRVTQVKLFYRTGSRGLFLALTAQKEGDTVHATVPKTAVKAPLVEYYLQGVDGGGLALVSRGDAAAPLRVAIPDSSKGWILPLAIGGSVLGAAAVVGVLALSGVFKSSSTTTHSTGPATSTVNVSVGDAWHRF